jgi:hypothetical protein
MSNMTTATKAKIQKNIFIEGTGQRGFITPAGISNQDEGVTSVLVYKGTDDMPGFKAGTERGVSYFASKEMFGSDHLKEFMIEIIAPDESFIQICLVAKQKPTLRTAGDFILDAFEILADAKSPKLDTFIRKHFPIKITSNRKYADFGNVSIGAMPTPIGIVEYENNF